MILKKILSISLLFLTSEIKADSTQLCPLWVHLPSYESLSCESSADGSCADVCAAESINSAPRCFRRFEIECSMKDDIVTSYNPVVHADGVYIVTLYQLFTMEKLLGKYALVRRELLSQVADLYYPISIRIPTLSGYALAKSAYRSQSLSAVKSLFQPLKDAAAFRRTGLGYSLEPEVDGDFQQLSAGIGNSRLLAAADKTQLISDVSTIKTAQVDYWNTVKGFQKDALRAARLKIFTSLLSKLNKQFQLLHSSEHSAEAIARIAESYRLSGITNAQCSLLVLGSGCFDLNSRPDLASYDDSSERGLDILEIHLSLLLNHLAALLAEEQDTLPAQSVGLNLAGNLSATYVQLLLDPGNQSLNRFEAALNIATWQLGRNGEELWQHLLDQADGISSVGVFYKEPVNDKKLDSCSKFDGYRQELKTISETSALLSNEATQLLEGGLTDQERERMKEIVDQMGRNASRVNVLSGLIGIDNDRVWNFHWQKPAGVQGSPFEVEYLEMDSMFWTANDPLTMQQMFPDLENLWTLRGSLLPRGIGKLGRGSDFIEISLHRSSWSACSEFAGKRIRMIVRFDTTSGPIRKAFNAQGN